MTDRRRRLELLAGRHDLTDQEQAELERLAPTDADLDAVRRAEDLLRRHLVEDSRMPDDVRRTIRRRANLAPDRTPLVVAWSVAALLAIGLGLAILFRPTPPPTRTPTIDQQRLVMRESETDGLVGDLLHVESGDGEGVGTVEWYPTSGTGFLELTDLPEARGDEVYQVWIIDGEGRPILGATFEHVRMVDFGKPAPSIIRLDPAMDAVAPTEVVVSRERSRGSLRPGRIVARAPLR